MPRIEAIAPQAQPPTCNIALNSKHLQLIAVATLVVAKHVRKPTQTSSFKSGPYPQLSGQSDIKFCTNSNRFNINEVFMRSCPCCSHQVLRHIRGHQLYYFCRHCWMEVSKLDQTSHTAKEMNRPGKSTVSHRTDIFNKVYPLLQPSLQQLIHPF